MGATRRGKYHKQDPTSAEDCSAIDKLVAVGNSHAQPARLPPKPVPAPLQPAPPWAAESHCWVLVAWAVLGGIRYQGLRLFV